MNDKWKELREKFKGANKQLLFLVALALVGITLLIYSPGKTNPENISEPQTTEQNNLIQQGSQGMIREEEELARKLEAMLGSINGVGDVKVSVRLAASTHSHYAFNTDNGEKVIREQDQSGGTRTTTETTQMEQLVLVRGPQGSEKPVIEKEIAPDIAGVLVVARGASRPEVRARLFQAVQVSLGVNPHKVIVLPMERGEG